MVKGPGSLSKRFFASDIMRHNLLRSLLKALSLKKKS